MKKSLFVLLFYLPLVMFYPQNQTDSIMKQQILFTKSYLLDVFTGNHENCWTNYHFESTDAGDSNHNSFLLMLRYYQGQGLRTMSCLDYAGYESNNENGQEMLLYKYSYTIERGDMISQYTFRLGMPLNVTNKLYSISLQVKPRKK